MKSRLIGIATICIALATPLSLAENSHDQHHAQHETTTNSALEIVIENAWVREAPPSSKIHAGYFSLQNRSKSPHYIISASSPLYERVELHKTTMHEGMMRMGQVDELTLNPHETIEFTPNGYHLMLINPKQAIKSGMEIELSLQLKNKTEIKTTAVVKKDTGDETGGHQHGEHHH